MNYIYLLIEIIIIFVLMLLFYRFGKKDGLFIYISLMATLLGLFMFKTIDVLSFEIDLGVPFIMGIFICGNVIVQRYGIDEVKDIIKSFVFPYIITLSVLCLVSLTISSEFNIATGDAYNELFGYNIDNIRIIVGYLLSIVFSLWYNCYIYFYIRRNKNIYLFSNIGSLLLIQFVESIIFILITYIGTIDITILFGMIVIRYLLKIIIGVISLVPFMFVIKMKS